MKSFFSLILFAACAWGHAQDWMDMAIESGFRETLKEHRAFVSMANLPKDRALMLQNINWVEAHYKKMGYRTHQLASSSLPILFCEKVYDAGLPTVLFYFHIDGQPADATNWDQEDPFVPVLKEQDADGAWQTLDWARLDGALDMDWRIYARAAADDKAPILMFIKALQILEAKNKKPRFNVKVIFDPEEEYGSSALLSTIGQYKSTYAADYFVVMDGPMHDSNRPTLTFGCRGIATCAITTYGSALPQHSGHFGNYVPNPVFGLAQLLGGMKDANGKVQIKDYYKGVHLAAKDREILETVPYDAAVFNRKLGIAKAESVGSTYQEALQYPTLNVRQIGTSWKGAGLKTIIPETATAYLDLRLVPEISGKIQLDRVAAHLKQAGYKVLDSAPTMEERLQFDKIVRFDRSRAVNAFRTSPEADFGRKLRENLERTFGEKPISIRMMGGTVPIIPLINVLDLPTVIVPMVNMDNNQHNPNENIRIGNIKQGIKICLSVLQTKL
ncbi:MAG: M20/M25/M40 family metallo-hydrolase [Flavobacteriaceae bacterium]|nr:M20/M25/M40 family metallo-hydrolase [Flavobacteriaceae bacterium]